MNRWNHHPYIFRGGLKKTTDVANLEFVPARYPIPRAPGGYGYGQGYILLSKGSLCNLGNGISGMDVLFIYYLGLG